MHVYTHTHIYIYIYACIHTYIYIYCIYVHCIYVHTHIVLLYSEYMCIYIYNIDHITHTNVFCFPGESAILELFERALRKTG